MKIATDLKQSKKLAKILPLKSADMFYLAAKGEPIVIGNKMIAVGSDNWDALGEPDVPAWSLSTLLEIIRNKQPNYESVLFVGKKDKYEYFISSTEKTKTYEDPIDACVDIVRWLYEKKLT